MLGGNHDITNTAATDLLYSGEQFDSTLQQQYLRARYYDQNSGRFNRLDPFAGNNDDPQSLHKYAYCHSDPVNAIDPTGEFTIVNILFTASVVGVMSGTFNMAVNKKFYTNGNAAQAFVSGFISGFLFTIFIAIGMPPWIVGGISSVVAQIYEEINEGGFTAENWWVAVLRIVLVGIIGLIGGGVLGKWGIAEPANMVKSVSTVALKDFIKSFSTNLGSSIISGLLLGVVITIATSAVKLIEGIIKWAYNWGDIYSKRIMNYTWYDIKKDYKIKDEELNALISFERILNEMKSNEQQS